MKTDGVVQDTLKREIKRYLNELYNPIRNKNRRVGNIRNGKSFEFILTSKNNLKKCLDNINEEFIIVKWKNGDITKYKPNEVYFYPELLIKNQPRRIRDFYAKIEREIKRIYYNKTASKSLRTYEGYLSAFRFLIVLSQISKPEDLESPETYKIYIDYMRIPMVTWNGTVAKSSNANIYNKLKCFSAILRKFMKRYTIIDGYQFTKDPVYAIKEDFGVPKRNKRRNRNKNEVEMWINSMSNPRDKAMWMLYALGLRNHEIRIYEVNENVQGAIEYSPQITHRGTPYKRKEIARTRNRLNRREGSIWITGLRINQIDWEKICLRNIKRKGSKELQELLMLDDMTLLAIKRWLEFRKENLPEIENDPMTAQFVFPILGRAFSSQIGTKHFEYLKNELLQNCRNRYEKRKAEGKDVSTSFLQELKTLENLIKNGKITPHELRHTWDTLADQNNMRETIRRYHLNHKLGSMDYVYVHVEYEDYRKEFDLKAPKFNFKVI